MNHLFPDLLQSPGTIALGLWALAAYALGAVPFGLIVARLFSLDDPRRIGSGNIGATNILRTGSRPAAALTLLLDAGKGAAAVLLAGHFAGPGAAQLAGLAAFLGHCYPIWLGFRGGKGVATFLGVLLALAWPVGLAACATWLVTALVGRYSSLAALMAAGFSPLWAVLLGRPDLFYLAFVLAVIIYWRHRANIARLRAGTEPRITRRR